MSKNLPRRPRGFTLVELMIVVAVIGIIASLAIPNYLRFSARANRSEMLETVSKMKLFFKSQYDNTGTMSTAATLPASTSSALNPAGDPGTASPWNNKASGWNGFEFPPDGSVRMRYFYTMGAPDAKGNVADVTIQVCGFFGSLGTAKFGCPGSVNGNYLYTEVFHGSGASDPPTEVPPF
jgi:prepilin-type N-terminal cleavage/methylation domain-containing protein